MRNVKDGLNKILIVVSICLLFVCGYVVSNYVETNVVSSVSYNEANVIEHNKNLLNEVKKIQNLADEYKSSTGVSTSSTDLTIQYLRKNRYGDSKIEWVYFLGNIDQNFITYVNNSATKPTIAEDAVIYDVNTGKKIDFIHTMATLMVYIKNETGMLAPAVDYAGWAGDLTTMLEEVVRYRLAGNTDTTVLQLYSNSIMGTNKSGISFPVEDVLGDFDALNLFKDCTNNGVATDLYTALYNYYVSLNSTNNSSNRMAKAYEYLGNSNTAIATLAQGYLSQTTYRQMLIPTTSSSVTSSDITIVVNSFVKYMNLEPYIELESTSSSELVGNTKKVKVYESNLDNEIIEVVPNIANVSRNGYEYSIVPTEAGNAVITIYSEKYPSIKATYNLVSANVAPSIKSDLLDSYDLVNRVNKEISISASGTNNVYTWYISDKVDSGFTVLATTNEPKYVLKPNMELNGKYIRCGIKNNGNTEIFTKVAKLNVSENPVVDTGDYTLPFAVAIIVLIVLANLIYNKYVKRKPLTHLIVK